MKKLIKVVFGILFVIFLVRANNANAAAPSVVPTFHCLGLYWSPAEGGVPNTCRVEYRQQNDSAWKNGLDLWFDARNKEYRGSLVHLQPDTIYEIKLCLQNTSTTKTFTAKTWSEVFPVLKTIYLPEISSSTLRIDQSGTNEGYILYKSAEGKTVTIDVDNNHDADIYISPNVHHVIIRGLTLKGGKKYGIRLDNGVHDIVIEENDISGWGDETDFQAAVYAHWNDTVEKIIIQRNKLHDPRSGASSWEHGHPQGPQAIAFHNSNGNHVIRYNEIYSSWLHYFNDGIGMGANYSFAGFPNKDSDIYGNIISHCWDDGIESEGANKNVRIWGNWIDKTFHKIAIASTSVGPLYIWRNVLDTSRQKDTKPDSDDYHRGYFIKAGGKTRSGIWYGSGRTYIFHNTTLQRVAPVGNTYTLGVVAGIINGGGKVYEVISRNNIITCSKSWWAAYEDGTDSCMNDLDYDLYIGDIDCTCATRAHQSHGFRAYPTYDPDAGVSQYPLASGTTGFDAGIVLPNFNDNYSGKAPDIGAFETGSLPMEFGVNAYRNGKIPFNNLIVQWGSYYSLSNGIVGNSYSQTFVAIGGIIPYTWNIVSGSLPEGLSFNVSTGVISGMPKSAGVFNFGVDISDSSIPQQNDRQFLSITIQPDTRSDTEKTIDILIRNFEQLIEDLEGLPAAP